MQRVTTETSERTQFEEVAVEEKESVEVRNKHVSMWLVRFWILVPTNRTAMGKYPKELWRRKRILTDVNSSITYCNGCINYILSADHIFVGANTESISRNCSISTNLYIVTYSKYNIIL